MKTLLDKKKVMELIDDISFFRDIANDFENEAFQYDLFPLEKMAVNLLNETILESVSTVDIAVIGNFSCGKSTFINSIIGRPICPMRVNPTTSSITKFIYGEEEEIWLITEAEKEKISKNRYLEICQHKSGQTDQTISYDIEYHYPFDIFKSVCLYDTPGFKNTQNNRDQEITERIAHQADVIFLLTDCNNGGAIDRDLEKTLEGLRDKNDKLKWYYILNRCDDKPPSSVKKMLNKQKSMYGDAFSEYFPYSALEVLENCKINNIPDIKNLNMDLHFIRIEKVLENYFDMPQNQALQKILNIKNELASIREHIEKIESNKDRKTSNTEFQLSVYFAERKKILHSLFDIGRDKNRIKAERLQLEKEHYKSQTIQTIENISKNLTQNENIEIKNFENKLKKLDASLKPNYFNLFSMEIKLLAQNLQKGFVAKELTKKERDYWFTPYAKTYCDQRKIFILTKRFYEKNKISDIFQNFCIEYEKNFQDLNITINKNFINKRTRDFNKAISRIYERIIAEATKKLKKEHENLNDASSYVSFQKQHFFREITDKMEPLFSKFYDQFSAEISKQISIYFGRNSANEEFQKKSQKKIDRFLEKKRGLN